MQKNGSCFKDGTLDCSQSISNTVTDLVEFYIATQKQAEQKNGSCFKDGTLLGSQSIVNGRNVTHASQDEDGQLVFASIEPALLNVEWRQNELNKVDSLLIRICKLRR